MILRSPTEYEIEGSFFCVGIPSARHSRARGNPGLLSAELAWIPAFAGMTEARKIILVIPIFKGVTDGAFASYLFIGFS
jgi:hypothetical protein